MYVIRSKKTGKTFLRFGQVRGIHEWVMFREEQPTLFAQRMDAESQIVSDFLSDVEVVPLSEVPKAEPDKSALEDAPTPLATEKPSIYYACDISGRVSGDEKTVEAVKVWMDCKNPNSGDCVIWEKPSGRIVMVRSFERWYPML